MAIERIEAEQRRDSGYKDKDKDEPEPKRELLKARDYKVLVCLGLWGHACLSGNMQGEKD